MASVAALFVLSASWALALQVDVTGIYYRDDAGREINYDFSSGTISGNTITLPDSAILQSPPAEVPYTFQVPAGLIEGATLQLNTSAGVATLQGTDDTVGVLVPSGTPAPSSNTFTWSVSLTNFPQANCEFSVGLGRPEDNISPIRPEVRGEWFTGSYNGTPYVNGLKIQAVISDKTTDTDIWKPAEIVISGLIPSSVVVDFKVEVQAGVTFIGSYRINGGAWTEIGRHTITSGTMPGCPDLWPYVDLRLSDSAPQPQVQSQHLWDGYYVWVDVYDQYHVVTSATVSGYGITGTKNLEYSNGSWSLTGQMPFLGTTSPVSPVSYTFTITTPTGTTTKTQSVTGYVTQFATNLLPTGNVSGPITFSWTGISGASSYGVSLFEEGTYNQIWQLYDLHNTTQAYNGPALVSGKTYFYNVQSVIVTNDMWNQSSAQGQFTYGVPPQYTLTVSRTGTGTVTSSPSGINCGSTCSASFTSGTSVILSSQPSAGSSFAGWSGGACYGASPTCSVTMDAPKTITAVFNSVGGNVQTFPLYAGWNLISVPYELTDNNVLNVLANIKDNVEIVWGFTPPDTWVKYGPTLPPVLNTLTELVPGKGYWIKLKATGITLDIP